MIQILRSTETGLEPRDAFAPGCWVNVVAPTAEEIARLQRVLTVPADFVTYPLDVDERARTERENGDLLVILRVPLYVGPDADPPYETVPVGIILTETLIVTLCQADIDVTKDLAAGRVRGLSTVKRNRFLLHLLLVTSQRYLAHLRAIDAAVDRLEDRLQRSMRNREVQELLKYQKSLTYFTTALKSNELMLRRLERTRLFEAFPDDEDLLEDVLTEVQQAIEMTNISSNILSQMMDAFASIISNNLNVVMKFLASITIVLSIPTIVASLYGMNVGLPLAGTPHAFFVVIGAMLVICALVVALFRRLDWF